MRPEEQYVMRRLSEKYGGSFRAGEDPPDAYLSVGDSEVGVEVSILTQLVITDDRLVPRRSQDEPALRIIDRLNDELKSAIPDGMFMFLFLTSPLCDTRRLHKGLRARIQAVVAQQDFAPRTEFICGNEVVLHLLRGSRESRKKVVGGVINRSSSADLLENAICMLTERIATKAKKCNRILHRPLWLALLNWFWLADEDTYRRAFAMCTVDHPFARLELVGHSGEVTTLFPQ